MPDTLLTEQLTYDILSKLDTTLSDLKDSIDAITSTFETTGVGDGRKTVSSAGTREKLVASSTPCKWVCICAMKTNTGIVVVGSNTVVAAEATRRGIPLEKGESVRIDIDDLSKIYLDVTVNGEGVTFIYGT